MLISAPQCLIKKKEEKKKLRPLQLQGFHITAHCHHIVSWKYKRNDAFYAFTLVHLKAPFSCGHKELLRIHSCISKSFVNYFDFELSAFHEPKVSCCSQSYIFLRGVVILLLLTLNVSTSHEQLSIFKGLYALNLHFKWKQGKDPSDHEFNAVL